MSDEQKMPEVMTRKWYPTLATRMAGDSSVAAMVDCEQRYNQEAYVTYADHLATIATLTAKCDRLAEQVEQWSEQAAKQADLLHAYEDREAALVERVRELVEAVKKMQQGGCISTCLGYIEEVDVDEWDEVARLTAQIKEQNDE